MKDLLFILVALVIGMTILMADILINREPGKSLKSAFNRGMVWGAGFFVCFGTELMVLTNF